MVIASRIAALTAGRSFQKDRRCASVSRQLSRASYVAQENSIRRHACRFGDGLVRSPPTSESAVGMAAGPGSDRDLHTALLSKSV